MPKPNSAETADRLHRAAIRLLRSLRAADTESSLSGPKISALSVLAFAGPQSLSSLARAEQVRAPTMSKLVADLEREGLAVKRADKTDGRGVVVAVTAKGRALMEAGRARRLALLRARFAKLSGAELQTLADAAELILRVTGD